MAKSVSNWRQYVRKGRLIGADEQQFITWVEQRSQELSQATVSGTPPVLILTETNPLKFLAGFLAACDAGCSVFLGNSKWAESEWQQVMALVQPDLVWGDASEAEQTAIRRSSPGSEGSPRGFPHGFGRIMIPTGGSSGRIRFAIHTWATLTASAKGFQQYFQVEEVNACCVLPLYHVSGLMQFVRAFVSGGQLCILPFAELESGKRPAIAPADFFLSLVPTQLQRLLQHPELSAWLSQFHTVLLGGAPAWSELLNHARQEKIRVALTYGMTETAAQVATLKPDDFLRGVTSCGQVLPHAQVTIQDSAGQEVGIHQIGTIVIQAASMALGYYGDRTSPLNYLQTDDLGFFNENGDLTLVGRSSQKIITGGENVFPGEVEAALRQTNLVVDVCVIGVPDRHWGEAITAVYVPQAPQLSIADLQNALGDRLSKFKHPKHYITVEQLPRNAQGKINYQQLKSLAIQRLALM